MDKRIKFVLNFDASWMRNYLILPDNNLCIIHNFIRLRRYTVSVFSLVKCFFYCIELFAPPLYFDKAIFNLLLVFRLCRRICS